MLSHNSMSLNRHILKTILFAILMPVLSVPALAQKSPKAKKVKADKTTYSPKVLSEQDRIYFEAYFIEGMRYYLIGQTKVALSFFDKAYSLDQTNGGLNYQLSKVNYSLSNNARALLNAQTAVKADSKNQEYLIQLAKVYEVQSNFEEANKVYKKLTTDFPNNEPYYYQIGANQIQLKQYDEAIKTYSKVESIFGRSFELTRQKQQLYVKQGKVDLAIKEGQVLIDSDPSNLQYQVDQAEFYYYIDQVPNALAIIDKVLKQDKDQVQAHVLLADIYKSKNEMDKAFVEYKYLLARPNVAGETKKQIVQEALTNATTDAAKAQLLELTTIYVTTNPSDNVALTSQGDALFVNNKKEEARKYYSKSAQLDGNNYNLWLQILTLDFEFKEYDTLVAHSATAIDFFPNQSNLWYFRGLAFFNLKRYPQSIEALEETRNLSGTNQALKMQSLLLLADAYNETKEYVKSDAAYDEVLKYDKNNDHALNNYSYYLSLRKEKLELAKSMSEKVVNRNPTEANFIDTYAWVLYQMKDYQGAKVQLEKAVAAGSTNGTILEHYGDVLFQLGDKKGALENWKKAKAAGDASALIDKKIADGKLYE
ncbi:TPR-repeat-containing protein [Cytophaga hutchinsonii ATCC 33406]|uniref:TPR-repeat-containing protein n=2 Tax=Cytophaga hutchinsonii TaxID=985 RepID=A0A6N4SM41_CYTH3|nr:TPR-repeat-containing protein [Cytophaga hutchinsonii ATCC 33406]